MHSYINANFAWKKLYSGTGTMRLAGRSQCWMVNKLNPDRFENVKINPIETYSSRITYVAIYSL